MPDIAAISMALTSLKNSTDLTKALLGLRDANLVREKTFELTEQLIAAHSHVLDAKTAQSALIDEMDGLKKKVAEFEDWDREKARYQLKAIGTRNFVYATKPGMENEEPAVEICPNCYQHRRVSILQLETRRPNYSEHIVCHSCKFELCTKLCAEPYYIALMRKYEEGIDPASEWPSPGEPKDVV